MRILLVEDDASLGTAVVDQLAADGHAVDRVDHLCRARHALAAVAYDLCLLDLMLPDGDGLALLGELRGRGDGLAVIILTARDQISDRIRGLRAGADDYLVKPFDLAELSARVLAVGRRSAGDAGPRIEVAGVVIDEAARTVLRDGEPVRLTQREWALLEALVHSRGRVLSRGQLEDRLYAFGAEVESNTIEVYISRLRKKLGTGLIATERGLGYRMVRS
ncbi:Transcriptional regulatory protein QseB [wastewater metagenome]|uniref:Transcriptional regulatory protein QseB n=2 Tax=unclassified sequences TaxID=12908 RepID=A0A5B8RET3_9ZZZZ|nr:response regulator transcription factor [Arhodomonas sp. KWT]QEA07131.1 transcriptional regulatory protein QseB [uncultured organism]